MNRVSAPQTAAGVQRQQAGDETLSVSRGSTSVKATIDAGCYLSRLWCEVTITVVQQLYKSVKRRGDSRQTDRQTPSVSFNAPLKILQNDADLCSLTVLCVQFGFFL